MARRLALCAASRTFLSWLNGCFKLLTGLINSMNQGFSKRKNKQSDTKPKRLSVQDGFKTAHFTRIIKSLEFVFLVTNCLGFAILVINDILNNSWLDSRMPYCFTYLIIVEFSLEVLMTYLRAKRTEQEQMTSKDKQAASRSPQLQPASGYCLGTFKEKLHSIIEFVPSLCRIHILLILVQPCVVWSPEINRYLKRLTSVRIYVLLRFYLTSDEMENARFKRLMRAFGSGFDLISMKIAVSRKYPVTVCWIAVFLIFGLGTIVNERVTLSYYENLLNTVYYVLISITTVGYGQIVVKDPQNRLVAGLIIVIGICVNSLLTVTVLQTFSLTKQQDNAYYLRQRLELIQSQKDFIGDKFAQLLDMAEMEDKLKEGLTEEEKNSMALEEQIITNGLSSLSFNNPVGEIRQYMFQYLIDNKTLTCQKIIKKNEDYKEIIAMYNDQRDIISELRSEMDRLNACNPISGSNMDNHINRIKNRVRALRYKNNVLNQLIEE